MLRLKMDDFHVIPGFILGSEQKSPQRRYNLLYYIEGNLIQCCMLLLISIMFDWQKAFDTIGIPTVYLFM